MDTSNWKQQFPRYNKFVDDSDDDDENGNENVVKNSQDATPRVNHSSCNMGIFEKYVYFWNIEE